ncbi:MAG TPA: NAD(P)-dependent oxidoreductase [Micromonospora sp.]|nr:NAD(P)-dependent oxidoreductase [Micromonospora sp.]
MTRAAWIGLGAMGSRMACRLLGAGHELSVWNRTRARAEPLAAAGARVAATPAEAVGDAEAVMLMLADPDAIHDVTEGPDGIAAGIRPGATVIDMSTVGPAAVARLRAALPDEIPVIDAPVLGSITEAEAGTLTIFVGGVSERAEAVAPLLSVLGNPIHVGSSGAGAAAKLVANSTLFGVLGVLGEALALGDGFGLPREAVWRILAATPLAAQAERRRPGVESGDPPRRFALSLAQKDADLILAAADAADVEVRLARAAQTWFADAEAAGIGDADYSAVLSHILRA